MLLQLGQMVHKEIEHGWFYLQPLVLLPEKIRKIMTETSRIPWPYNNELKNIDIRACFKKGHRTTTKNFKRKKRLR
jgi:hypothetical protein